MSGFSFSTKYTTSSSSSPFSFSSFSSPSSSSSLFGASAPSNPTFGAPSSSSTQSFGFSFASSSSSTPSSAAPSPALGFGAPSAAATGFGASSPAVASPFGGSGLFGSSSSATGTTTTTTTSLFGSNSSPAFGTSSLFGASSGLASISTSNTNTSANSPFSSSLFGTSSSSGTTFGAAPSITSSTSTISSTTAPSFPNLFGASSSSSGSTFGATPSLTSSTSTIASASASAPSFPNLFGSSSSSSASSTFTNLTSLSGASSSSSNSSSTTTQSAPSAAPSLNFSFPGSATSAPSFSFSTSSAMGKSTAAVSISGSAPSSSSATSFSFSNVTTSSGLQSSSGLASSFKTASTSATTTNAFASAIISANKTPSFPAFGVTSSSGTTASTPAGSVSSFPSLATVAAASTGTSSSFLGFQTSSKTTGASTPASQPQSTSALSLFGVPASTTTTSTVTTTSAQTSSALVVSSSSGTTSSFSTAVVPTPKLPSEITGKTVEELAEGGFSAVGPEAIPPADTAIEGDGLASLAGLDLEQEVTVEDVSHASMNIGDFTCYGCGLPDHLGVPCPVGHHDSSAATQTSEEAVPDPSRDVPPSVLGVPSGASDPATIAPSSSTRSAGPDQPTRVPEPSPFEAHEPSLDSIYVPAWTIREDQTTQTGRVCRELLNHFCPPRERERLGLITDEQLEVRINLVLAQNAALGIEMQNRFVQRTVELRHLQEQFTEQAEASHQQKSDLKRLSSHLHSATEELAVVKREAAVSAARIAELEHANFELYRKNQSLEIKANLPNLPAGHVSLPQPELDTLRSSLDHATSEVQSLRNLVLSKDLEKLILSEVIQSAHDANRSLIEQRDAALETKAWLLRQGVKVYTSKLMESGEFLGPFGGVCEAARLAGYAEGVQAGFRGARLKQPLSQIPQYDAAAAQKYDDALAVFPQTQFPFFDIIAASSDLPLESLRDLSPAGTDDDAT